MNSYAKLDVDLLDSLLQGMGTLTYDFVELLLDNLPQSLANNDDAKQMGKPIEHLYGFLAWLINTSEYDLLPEQRKHDPRARDFILKLAKAILFNPDRYGHHSQTLF